MFPSFLLDEKSLDLEKKNSIWHSSCFVPFIYTLVSPIFSYKATILSVITVKSILVIWQNHAHYFIHEIWIFMTSWNNVTYFFQQHWEEYYFIRKKKLPLKWRRALKSVKTITINLLQELTGHKSSILNKYKVELFNRKF